MPDCSVCGSQDFTNIDGFFYCTLCQTQSQVLVNHLYTPLQKKRNIWFRCPHDPSLGSATPRGQKVISRGSFPSLKSRKLPLLTTFWPYRVVDPTLGSRELLNQVLHFFWRGVYIHVKEYVLLLMGTNSILETNFGLKNYNLRLNL